MMTHHTNRSRRTSSSTPDPDRLRTSAHINRSFAHSAELGTLEADEPKSADFYRGRADAYEEAAQFLESANGRLT